jgi:NAD(P)-dependent dehydrogenase (short-subunit alcohol dehydrogenase family)
VLITGGAKGIGRMISEGFVANGAKVYISSRDAKACEQACKELNALGSSDLFPCLPLFIHIYANPSLPKLNR